MKKIITLLFLATIFTNSIFSQSDFFVGEDAHLLIGKRVKVKDGKSFYDGFYKNSKLTKILFKKGVGSNYDKLKKMNFKVVGTSPNPKSYSKDIVLILEDNGKNYYYSYNPKYSSVFLLDVIDKIDLPEDYYCKKLKSEKDKFNNETVTRTPYKFEYSIAKYEKDGKINIYLTLRSYGSSLISNRKGVIILFMDGTKLEKPDTKISVKSSKGNKGWDYSVFLKLNDSEIKTLKSKTISDYRLYVVDREMNKENSNSLKEYLKCLTK